MSGQLLLACGCVVPFREGHEPQCVDHGRSRVVRVVGMPAPRFRGVVRGPVAEPVELDPFVGRLPGLEEGKE